LCRCGLCCCCRPLHEVPQVQHGPQVVVAKLQHRDKQYT
jgi:hypothetical protein